AASSGSVAMFHAVGLTPEAATLEAAIAPDRKPDRVRVDVAAVRAALASLATVPDGPIDAVALGTPHFSIGEVDRVRAFLAGWSGRPKVELTVNTSRGVLAEITERGWLDELAAAGVIVVTDTCTYLS